MDAFANYSAFSSDEVRKLLVDELLPKDRELALDTFAILKANGADHGAAAFAEVQGQPLPIEAAFAAAVADRERSLSDRMTKWREARSERIRAEAKQEAGPPANAFDVLLVLGNPQSTAEQAVAALKSLALSHEEELRALLRQDREAADAKDAKQDPSGKDMIRAASAASRRFPGDLSVQEAFCEFVGKAGNCEDVLPGSLTFLCHPLNARVRRGSLAKAILLAGDLVPSDVDALAEIIVVAVRGLVDVPDSEPVAASLCDLLPAFFERQHDVYVTILDTIDAELAKVPAGSEASAVLLQLTAQILDEFSLIYGKPREGQMRPLFLRALEEVCLLRKPRRHDTAWLADLFFYATFFPAPSVEPFRRPLAAAGALLRAVPLVGQPGGDRMAYCQLLCSLVGLAGEACKRDGAPADFWPGVVRPCLQLAAEHLRLLPRDDRESCLQLIYRCLNSTREIALDVLRELSRRLEGTSSAGDTERFPVLHFLDPTRRGVSPASRGKLFQLLCEGCEIPELAANELKHEYFDDEKGRPGIIAAVLQALPRWKDTFSYLRVWAFFHVCSIPEIASCRRELRRLLQPQHIAATLARVNGAVSADAARLLHLILLPFSNLLSEATEEAAEWLLAFTDGRGGGGGTMEKLLEALADARLKDEVFCDETAGLAESLLRLSEATRNPTIMSLAERTSALVLRFWERQSGTPQGLHFDGRDIAFISALATAASVPVATRRQLLLSKPFLEPPLQAAAEPGSSSERVVQAATTAVEHVQRLGGGRELAEGKYEAAVGPAANDGDRKDAAAAAADEDGEGAGLGLLAAAGGAAMTDSVRGGSSSGRKRKAERGVPEEQSGKRPKQD